ncbi:MAG: VTT domain-containing protein [Candidatus Thiodiazotropha sp. (ex Myrtea sp. 'scaly one' KF741663)]|nr:VTT domain-containing protein [Candidatus Thiodiazotropha sp. (ex Myrtea sp. 'scaly one' KF741663)]
MSELFTTLLTWIADNPFWAGVAVFLVAFSESVAVFGLLIPGVVMMFGFGALIATGTLEFWPVFWWAVAGAVAGDGLSFWLGRHFQDHLRELWPFNRHPKVLQRGIDFFEKYGGKSVAIGRFFGPVRAIIPLVAGMMNMKAWRFLLANLLSALAWAPAYLLPGIVFGASLELASEVALRLVILMLLLLVSAWLLFITVRGLFRLIQPHATQIVQRGFEWGQLHPGFRSISRALADPNHPEAKGLAFLATLLLITTLLFVLLTGTVLGNTPTQGLDLTIFNTLQSLRSPWGDHLMTAFSVPGDLSSVLIIASGLAGVLWLRGQRRASYYLIAATLFGLLVPLLLKYTLRIPRPPAAGDGLGPWSFPSAHVLRTLTLYGFFSIMVARTLLREWRWLPYSLAALVIGAVALSRLYLGVHWLTDVLGSLMLGTAWTALLGIAYHRHVEAVSQRSLLIGSLLLLVIPTTALAISFHDARLTSYQPRGEIISLPLESWQLGIEQQLPQYRYDIRGDNDQPLNIVLAGQIGCLHKHLELQGWQAAEMLQWQNLLRMLSPRTPTEKLPVLPQVHAGEHEIDVLSKEMNDGSRLLLRLWSTHIRLDPGTVPVYVGTISRQRAIAQMNLLTIPRTDKNFNLSLQKLLTDITPLSVDYTMNKANRLWIDLTREDTCHKP